jgi:hypothetical protein
VPAAAPVGQTLNTAIPKLSDYANVGVFSSGLIGGGGGPRSFERWNC